MDFKWYWNINDFYKEHGAPVSDIGVDPDGFANWIGDTFFGGSHGANEVNLQIARENIEHQKAANEQNIAFQREENALTRMREDTAVQRAASDMTAAGLSKTLAAGSPASASALQAPQTEALSNSYQHQKNLAGMNAFNMMKELHFEKKADERADNLNSAQVAQANAQADLIRQQAYGQQLSNSTYMQNFANEQFLKNSQAFLFGQQSRYYSAQADIQEIVGKNTQREIDEKIAGMIQSRLESVSKTELNYSQMHKIAEEITSEIIKQEGYKLDNKNKEQAFYNAVQELVNAKLEGDIMTWNLDFAQDWGYPTGQYPSSLFGVLERMGKGKANLDRNFGNFAKNQYTNFAHGMQDAMQELGDFYKNETDVVQGGGFLDILRSLLNFNPLTWLFNK